MFEIDLSFGPLRLRIALTWRDSGAPVESTTSLDALVERATLGEPETWSPLYQERASQRPIGFGPAR